MQAGAPSSAVKVPGGQYSHTALPQVENFPGEQLSQAVNLPSAPNLPAGQFLQKGFPVPCIAPAAFQGSPQRGGVGCEGCKGGLTSWYFPSAQSLQTVWPWRGWYVPSQQAVQAEDLMFGMK